MRAAMRDHRSLRVGSNYPSPITRILALGYSDGPTEGVLQVGDQGEVYRFAVVDQFPGQGDEGTDLRLFGLFPLPPGALGELVTILAPHAEPRWPVWVPLWRFPSDSIRREVEERVDRVLALAGPVQWQITASDLMGRLRTVKDLETSCPG
jgi:hypothetical protein